MPVNTDARSDPNTCQQVTVLGSTGSIGRNTLDVVARHPDRYRVLALTGQTNMALLAEQCDRFQPSYAVVPDAAAREQLLSRVRYPVEILMGTDALCEVAAHPSGDMVMVAIVGAAGLHPSLAAARAGKKVLLANKESLVVGGALFMAAVADHGATLLPIDSEHNAIFQCLPHGKPDRTVSSILLTASGGPCRTLSAQALATVTPEQACAHPNWSMGRKISVDSATLMNKGLELIEACWLFDLAPSSIEVVVHPQSVIHSMVRYVDGSVLAQLGAADMRTPIAYGLAWPDRIDAGVQPLDFGALSDLQFEPPDEQRFPCLRLARHAMVAGGTAPAILNAANEVANAAFLDHRVGFTDIARINEAVLDRLASKQVESLDHVMAVDNEARRVAEQCVTAWTSSSV